MSDDRISTHRLRNLRITRTGMGLAEQVVDWLGAVQAQEYEPATWALGLRMKGDPVRRDLEDAFEAGRILRTHVMRPTWHFVTQEAIRWLLELTAPCVHRRMAVYNRHLELDPPTMTRGAKIFERALRDRQFLTRIELGERLRRAGLEASGPRLAHLAMHAELEGVICSGPRRGRQFTYGLIAERAPEARRLGRDESLAELARRYLRSHGPATIRDFVWWSGLTTADARRGFEACRAASEAVDGLTYWSVESPASGSRREATTHLLPIYDEYLIAYRDRVAVPHGPSGIASSSGQITSSSGKSVIFQHAVVIDGHVAGTWRTFRRSRDLEVTVTPLRKLKRDERRALVSAGERYQRYLETPVELKID
jgi:Winged helix DNA-binding domain